MKTDNKRRAVPKAMKGLFGFSSAKKKQQPPSVRIKSLKPQAPTSFLILSVLVVVISCLAFIYHLQVRFEGVRLGYETSQARAERARLIVERRELRLELASLKSPGEVDLEAREKLGMEIPDHRRIVSIGDAQKPVFASGRAR